MPNSEAVGFIKVQIEAWIGNLMRDLDARGVPVDTEDVAIALEQVAYMVHSEPTKEDFDNLLRDLNEGREWP